MYYLRKATKVFWILAAITYGIVVFIWLCATTPGQTLFESGRDPKVAFYILHMIPVIFASIAIALRVIAKAIKEQRAETVALLEEIKSGQKNK